MELDEIYRDLKAILDRIETVADEPDDAVDVDDGFAILSMARYEALREAEEHLQETRFGPSDGDPSDPNSLSRRVVRQYNLILDQAEEIDRLQVEVGHLREAVMVRADAGAPLKPSDGEAARAPDTPNTVGTVNAVVVRHIQDLQAEIGGIKDRLEEGCGEFRDLYGRVSGLSARLDEQSDRLLGFIARMNKIEADVMPIRRIGPGTGPQDQQRVEATTDRLLQEIKRVTHGVESTRP
jgi:hypothetical protein